MSYSISVSGHGADVEAVKSAFAELVGALDAATSDTGSKASGQLSGTETSEEGVAVAFLVRADDARAGDAGEAAEEPAGAELPAQGDAPEPAPDAEPADEATPAS